MRKTWMLAVIFVGCLMGVSGCSGLISSLAMEAGLSALSSLVAALISDAASSTAS
jgi:hypothetical protein